MTDILAVTAFFLISFLLGWLSASVLQIKITSNKNLRYHKDIDRLFWTIIDSDHKESLVTILTKLDIGVEKDNGSEYWSITFPNNVINAKNLFLVKK
jgi:hypothetical protein